jgi:sugar phosphate isomerase/epimerase
VSPGQPGEGHTPAVSTALFDGHPRDRALAELAAAGVAAVEPAYIPGYIDFDETAFSDAAAAELRRCIAAEGLRASALSGHVNLGGAEAVEKIRRRTGFAANIGAAIVVSNAAPESLRGPFLENLERIVPLCEAAGVVLALENPGHGTDAIIADAASGMAVIDAFASPWLRLNYDLGNVFTYSRERRRPEDDVEAALPGIAQFHVKDIRSAGGDWVFTAVGDGSLGYRGIARRLARLAPDVPVCLELPLRLSRPGQRDPERRPTPLPLDVIRAALRRSLEFWSMAFRAEG